jgi:MtN3 and saliva related transmembrane protein
MIDFVEVIGLIAGACTTGALLPQVFHVLKTKSTGDISLHMYIILCTGVGLWMVYGLLNSAISLILTNLVTFLLAFTILLLKIKNERTKKSSPTSDTKAP